MSTAETHEPTEAPHSWIGLIGGLAGLMVGAAAAFFLVTQFLQTRPVDLQTPTRNASEALDRLLASHHIPETSIEKTGPIERRPPQAHWYHYEYAVQLPPHLSVAGTEHLIEKRLREQFPELTVRDRITGGHKSGIELAFGGYTFAGVELIATSPPPAPRQEPLRFAAAEPEAVTSDAEPSTEERREPLDRGEDGDEVQDAVADVIQLASIIGRPWVPPHRGRSGPGLPRGRVEAPPAREVTIPVPRPSRDGAAKLAIIIDDGGYGGPATETILGLSPKLTLAILPNTPHGTELARRAVALGFEVLLHMPMENLDPLLYPHEGQLQTTMSEETIRELTQAALEQVPGAVGINNHMGSLFTSDPRAMARFIGAIHDGPLFFIDSRTTPDTRAYEMARAYGIRAAERDLFLDHDNGVESIRKRFKQVIALAKEQGQAIAIGHFRPNTAAVLVEMLRTLEAEGVELVHASSLVQ